jgi:hypothetical protein
MKRQAPAKKPYRMIYNCDCTEAFRRYPTPLSAAQLGMTVDEVAGRQVEAYCWSPNAGLIRPCFH